MPMPASSSVTAATTLQEVARAEMAVISGSLSFSRSHFGRHNPTSRASQPDPDEALALAEAAQADFVAVFQERAALAVGQRQGLTAACGQLDQRARLDGGGARLGAGSEQIAGDQVAPVDRMVRHHLRDRPV